MEELNIESYPSSKTAVDSYFDRLETVKERVNGVDTILVRGIGMPIAYVQGKLTKEQELEVEKSVTDEQISKVRNIILTSRRQKFIQGLDEIILEGYALEDESLKDDLGDPVLIFTNGFSNHVIKVVKTCLKSLSNRHLAEQVDFLFALTYALYNRRAWAYEYTDLHAVDRMLNLLAFEWKRILSTSNSNENLGMDSEFTRPGVECFLENFTSELPFPFQFDWNPERDYD